MKSKLIRKKNKDKRIVDVLLILVTIFIVIFIVFFSIFHKDSTLTVEDFKKMALDNNLQVQDVTNSFDTEIVSEAYVAYNKYGDYQIDYVIFKSDEDAKGAFTVNKNNFSSNKGEDDKEYSISEEKISKYSLTTNDKYMYVSRKNNTIVFTNVDGSYKVTVANIISKLKY